MKRRRLVISAVNLTEGGPLTILQDFVTAACATLPEEWEIVVLVNRRGLVSAQRPSYIEIPQAKRSWLRRMWVEWVEFRRYAEQLAPDLWLSLQDVSPSVGRVPQAVYIHNPIPFFPARWRDCFYEPKHAAFKLAYAWVYRINLKRNRAVIVQQSWLREKFSPWLRPSTQIIVANPSPPAAPLNVRQLSARSPGPAVFLYPALPRTFKNHELLGQAVARLEAGSGWRSEILLTVDGTENRYAHWLKRKFGHLKSLRFLGRQTRAQMEELYKSSDCLLFPSRIETWGLPISEAQQHHMPMLVADLPYARETVGSYDRVGFFDVGDAVGLADRLLAFQQGRFEFRPVVMAEPRPPFVRGMPDLVDLLMRACLPAAGATDR